MDALSEREVRLANRAAAALAPRDARWILATLTARSIEGGRAAIIRPEIRRRLVARAESMGLRPFDANLVIAIVQDDARSSTDAGTTPSASSGSSSAGTPALVQLSADAIDRLALVRPAPSAPSSRMLLMRLILAAVAGLVGAAALARWLLSA